MSGSDERRSKATQWGSSEILLTRLRAGTPNLNEMTFDEAEDDSWRTRRT